MTGAGGVRPFARVLFVGLLLGPWARANVVHENPLRQREIAIARQLRCTVCQAESVAESNAGIARDMRKLIRQKLAQGESPQQIVQYFVNRYGDYILLKPRFDRLGAVLWVTPFALAVLLGLVAYAFLRRRRPSPSAAYPQLSPEDEARVRSARGVD